MGPLSNLVVILVAVIVGGCSFLFDRDPQVDANADATIESGISIDSVTSFADLGFQANFAHSIGDGENRLLLVGSHVESGSFSTLSVTFNGEALTQIGSDDQSANVDVDCASSLWFIVNPSVGDHRVVATIGDQRHMAIWAMSFSGVSPSIEGADSSATNEDGDLMSVETTVAGSQGELIVDNFCLTRSGPMGQATAASGQEERANLPDESRRFRVAASTKAVTGALTTMRWTHSPGGHTHRTLLLHPASP